MAATSEVRSFFDAYEAAANELDAERIERFFADTCMAAAPGFVACTPDRDALRAALSGMVESYRAIERGDVRVVDIDALALGAYHVLATVQWTASFPAVAAPIPFEISYLLQRREDDAAAQDGMRIIGFVSHTDERALMQEHGILPPQ
jgi:hypothetical protein